MTKIKHSEECLPSIKIIDFLRTLKLPSAEFYGKPFEPLPWFKEVIRGIYDDLDENGNRNIREAYIQIARKNAKSVSISGLALYHALIDGEMDGQIYIVASDTGNAKVIFKMLCTMIKLSPVLSELCEIINYRNEIRVRRTDTIIKAMSSEADNKHGLSPTLVIYDELHTAKNRELYDVMQTGMGARRQPLIIAITTAGNDTSSFCYQQYLYAKRNEENKLAGREYNHHFYTYIKEIGENEDWKDEKNWIKANPSLGLTVKLDYIRGQFQKALEQVSAENNFRRLHCNQWVQQANRWFSMELWNKQVITETSLLDIDLDGLPCWCGLDLSSSEDLTCFVQVFNVDENLILIPHFFLPQDTVSHHTNSRYYELWERDGYLKTVMGDVIRYDWVAEYISKINTVNPIQAIAFDPWNANQMIVKLNEMGFDCIEYPQSGRLMNNASKEFERRLKEGTVWHKGHPILDWCAGNVMVKIDANDNIIPRKPSQFAKIDGIVASIMGCDLALKMHTTETVYEYRDPIVI